MPCVSVAAWRYLPLSGPQARQDLRRWVALLRLARVRPWSHQARGSLQTECLQKGGICQASSTAAFTLSCQGSFIVTASSASAPLPVASAPLLLLSTPFLENDFEMFHIFFAARRNGRSCKAQWHQWSGNKADQRTIPEAHGFLRLDLRHRTVPAPSALALRRCLAPASM